MQQISQHLWGLRFYSSNIISSTLQHVAVIYNLDMIIYSGDH
jgi:hypothetical protein